jgi:hypothetical protein
LDAAAAAAVGEMLRVLEDIAVIPKEKGLIHIKKGVQVHFFEGVA